MVELKLEFPERFFEEEVRCDFLVTKKRKEIWAVELDLLAEFMRVCDKYDLKYSVEGGTLLGAVRHHGYIPWDDDIDIAMLREDYDKLIKVANAEFKAPYFWQTEETDPGSIRGHAQLRNSETTAILNWEKGKRIKYNQGIFIDIFPFDNIPENDELVHKQYNKIVKLKKRVVHLADLSINYSSEYNYSSNHMMNIVKKYVIHPIICLLPNYFSYKLAYRKFENECKKYNGICCPITADLCLPVGIDRMKRKKNDFDDLDIVPFEFLRVPIYHNWKENLTISYGPDFMVFKKGVADHGGLFFDTSKSYKFYGNEDA